MSRDNTPFTIDIDDEDHAPAPAPVPWWRRAATALATSCRRMREAWRDARQTGDIPEWLDPAGLLVGLVGIGVALGLIILVVNLISAALTWVGDQITWSWDWFTTWPITAVVLDPVRAWITAHSTGLPKEVTADLLGLLWLGGLAVLFTLATLKSFGARIGWTLAGAATIWMAWDGSPATSRAVAAGLTGLAWALLSVLALHRVGHGTLHIHQPPVLPAPRAEHGHDWPTPTNRYTD